MSNNVRSAPMTNNQPAADLHAAKGRVAVPWYAWLSLGLLAIAFAVPGWLVGARLTLEGWVALLNGLIGLFGTPGTLAVPAGAGLFIGTLVVGALYSAAELAAALVRKVVRHGWQLVAILALVWLVVLGTDYASTAFGILFADAVTWPQGARPLLVWLGEDYTRTGVATAVLTHYPEFFIIGGAFALRRAFRG